MEGIRKRMMRANALNASNQREAYHAEMRLIQQVISPPFLFLLTADVSSGNRRKRSANFSLPFAAFPRVRWRKQHTETRAPPARP